MARAPARHSFGNMFRGGGKIPPIIVVLMAATFVFSVVGAVGLRHGFPLSAWAALVPSLVLHGQLWRLFTWVFFEMEPLSLLFTCLTLYWFGRDLSLRWGTVRFVLFYFGLATIVGTTVVLLSRIYPPLREAAYIGSWPIQEALIILWASFYPTRQIMVYFVLPLGGRSLVLLTIAGTVLFSVFYGLEMFIPHFIAEGLALAMVALPSPTDMWLEHKLRGLEKTRRATHLRSVPRDSDPEGGAPPRGSDGDGPPSGRWLN